MITSVALIWVAAGITAPSLTPAEVKPVDAFIADQARRRARANEPVEEFGGARKVARGDVDGDGKPDLVVLFTLEQGNTWTQFLAVFQGPGTRPLASTRVGGKAQRSVRLQGIDHGSIELETKNYGPADALCCPSVVGRSRFSLLSGAIEETEALISPRAR